MYSTLITGHNEGAYVKQRPGPPLTTTKKSLVYELRPKGMLKINYFDNS
jgi:hypothetical protein